MILILDNFDSFTYNLVQYVMELGYETNVVRNNSSVTELRSLNPDGLLVSPGPCSPHEAGCSIEAIQYFSGRIPVLGVCLGHQSLAAAFGGTVVRAPVLMHGKVSSVVHNGDPLFHKIPSPFQATRYHSLVVSPDTLPRDFTVTATVDDVIMALRHTPTGALGVQFHPESILTNHGKTILNNFCELTA